MKNTFLAISLLFSATIFSSEVPNYIGRSLYHHALDQIVVGYKMGCLSRTTETSFDQFKEGYDCRKFNTEDNLPPILRLEARSDLKLNKLLSLELIPLTTPIILDNDEEIVGEDVLGRVLYKIEMITQLPCTQESKTDETISFICPRQDNSSIKLKTLINTDLKPRISKIIFDF